jgi:hypothetical protein
VILCMMLTRSNVQEHHANLSNYVEMVEQTIDLEKLEGHVYMIKPDYDERLKGLADKLFKVPFNPFTLYR